LQCVYAVLLFGLTCQFAFLGLTLCCCKLDNMARVVTRWWLVAEWDADGTWRNSGCLLRCIMGAGPPSRKATRLDTYRCITECLGILMWNNMLVNCFFCLISTPATVARKVAGWITFVSSVFVGITNNINARPALEFLKQEQATAKANSDDDAWLNASMQLSWTTSKVRWSSMLMVSFFYTIFLAPENVIAFPNLSLAMQVYSTLTTAYACYSVYSSIYTVIKYACRMPAAALS